jgi:polyhydroxyalkanoate synthase subunit PhaC
MSTISEAKETSGTRAASRAALEVMLTDAAIEPPSAIRVVQPGTAVKLAAGLARHPQRVGRGAGALASELARVAAGRSEVAPPKGDRRFGDRAWQESWMFRRLMQSYLAIETAGERLVDDAELDWRSDRRARFMLDNLLDAVAPTNFALTNPTVLKETIDRGGANLVKGGRRFLRDASNGRLPAMVDTTKFQVGGNLAVSEGGVVLHTDVFELIQYRPTTAEVYERPLLIVPPTINKYYVFDLAPGRSLVEYFVAQGHQVFMISWRNPGEEHSYFDFDTYAGAIREARDAVAEIAGQDAVNVIGACSGGILTAGLLGHLADEGGLDGIASVALFVSAIANEQPGTAEAFATKPIAAAAVAESARRGYLDGEALASVFAWLRPNDLIWNYVVNNYLLGKEPPAFDILYWNQDAVRLAAGLHRDFVMMALDNAFATPGGMRVLGSDVDLGKADVDAYIVAGSNDHIVDWRNAYQSTQLLGGDNRFVLSTSGHIQAMINPPSPDSRSSYRVAESNPVATDEWEAMAATHRGSWWPDYLAWLEPRSGALVPAPKKLGSRKHKAVAKAPGIYVLAS